MEPNYKIKYNQLKLQYVNSLDVAFRLGYEKGQQDSQLEQMQAQQQQQAEMDAQQQLAPEEQGDEAAEQPGQPPEGGSELDQHINKLESMLGKSEVSPEDIQSALSLIKSFREDRILKSEIRKSDKAVKNISKALKPKFAIGKIAMANMKDNDKKTLSLQEKIVDDLMRKFEDEETKASKDITSLLAAEGLLKKE